jgi:hypothetical protein
VADGTRHKRRDRRQSTLPEPRTFRILNLGAGVGSTTVFLLAAQGKIPPVDVAIFADTQEEPTAVYEHLQWLVSLGLPPVWIRSIGKLGDDLIAGHIAAGNQRKKGRFTSIPSFTAGDHNLRDNQPASGCNYGRVQRQCTRDYKIDVVDQAIRKDLLHLKKRQRFPKHVQIVQLFGLDDGEGRRIKKVRERFEEKPWATPEFPLQQLGWKREHCVAFLEAHVPHPVPRSACVFCPYRSNTEWLWLKQHDPAGWQRAVAIDEAIRDPSAQRAEGLRESLYLHRQCIPLPMVDIETLAAAEAARPKQLDLFGLGDCGEGMCGV